jgi:hypothetical protein
MLHSLRHEWAPRCMVVSFKLETDESILVKKVRPWQSEALATPSRVLQEPLVWKDTNGFA